MIVWKSVLSFCASCPFLRRVAASKGGMGAEQTSVAAKRARNKVAKVEKNMMDY